MTEKPICRYCHAPIERTKDTPGLWFCPSCGMAQTVEGDPELVRC